MRTPWSARSLPPARLSLPLGVLAAAALALPTGGAPVVTAAPASAPLTAPLTAEAAALLAQHDAGPSVVDGVPASESWFAAQRAGGGPRARALAVTQARALQASSAATDPAGSSAAWGLLGPSNIGARVLDIAVDPTTPDAAYVATASGGLWRTTDRGTTFAPVWADVLPPALGAVAVLPDGVVLAGTGEAGPGGGSTTFGGAGVFRSADQGRTWAPTGLATSGAISRIAVDPADPRVVYAAAAGDLYRPGGERGLYRSTDGGRSWSLAVPGLNDTTGATDVAVSPDGRTVLVALWDHVRTPQVRRYGGAGSGVYRSTDGGATFTPVASLGGFTATTGRIGLAIAPSAPQIAYAIVVNARGNASAFWSTTDGGATWTKVTDTTSDTLLAGSNATFGWWFSRVFVDPRLPTHVFVPGVSLLESFTGGLGWVPVTGIHADQHAMAWDTRVPGLVYQGDDGGFWRSTTPAGPTTFSKGGPQPWTQFYSVDTAETDSRRVVGGAQDNGVLRSYATAGTQTTGPDGLPLWNSYGGGDGLRSLIDPTDANVVYGCSQYGSCRRSVNGGDSSTGLGATPGTRRNWFTPLELAPQDNRVVYYASNVVSRSTDQGRTWTQISPDLTGGDPALDPDYRFGTVTTLAPSAVDGQVLWAGTDDGRIWRTTDLGTWTRTDQGQLPGDWVTRIVASPDDVDTAWATFSGFRSGDGAAKVMRTDDGGRTWRDVGKGLPIAPVNDVVLVDQGIAVGTDVGVFRSRSGQGGDWTAVGAGLPLVPVMDVRWHAPTSTLTVGTFGRGAWRVAVPATPPTPVPALGLR